MKRISLLFGSLFLCFVLLITGCTQQNQSSANARNEFAIPVLKPRPAGLSGKEFQTVKTKYDALAVRLVKNPSDIKALTSLAGLFSNEARVTGDHPYYYPAAENMLDRALKLDTNNLEALLLKGSVLLSLHKFGDALTVGRKAQVLAPHLAYVYGILCDAYVELGDYTNAVKVTDSMVAIRPDLTSYSRVSYLREIHGDDHGATDAMIMAVKAGPDGREDTEWARFTLGNLYMNRGMLAQAKEQYQLALMGRPNYPFALGGLARVLAAENNIPQALILLDSASKLMPEFSFVEFKADLYRAKGQSKIADSLVSVVESMLKQDQAAGHNVDKEFALLYARHGYKINDAVDCAHRELARRPDNIEAQHAMAVALCTVGKAAEAQEMITKALRMKTNNSVMLADAGMIQLKLGNRDAGIALIQKARAINPHLPPIVQHNLELAAK